MSVSLYMGELLNKEVSMAQAARLNACFDLSPEFLAILIQTAKDEGFTNQRFEDAVSGAISSCRYRLTVADVLGYDKRARLYSYFDVRRLAVSGKGEFAEFFKWGKCNGVQYYVKITEMLELPEHLRERVRSQIKYNRKKEREDE